MDLILLTPIYDSKSDCTFKAIVSTISTEKHRNTAVVLAEDLLNGEILRCDIILDVIHDLGVLTTTRELFLEEAPETFELWAQDSQGNAFTTLEGIEFNWEITTQKNQNADNLSHEINTWDHVLRFIPFSESKYHETPKSLHTFEQLGKKGYMVLLEGINSGTAQVKVNLPYKEYEHVSEVTVDIVVLANLLLDPLDINILIGDQIAFKVLQLKQGKVQEISLNNQYYLEIEDINTANVNGKIVTGTNLGKTYVVLKDRNVPLEQYSKIHNGSPLPKASISVVLPYKLSLSLLPHYNFLTIVNEKHTIVIDLYTKNDQKISIGRNYKFDCSFNETIFKKERENSQGNYINGIAIKEGITTINAFFKKFDLSTTAELRVLKELEISPKKIILPISIASNQPQKIQFFATGGDGFYTWSTLNTKLLLISQTGLAETQYESLEMISENSVNKESNLEGVTSVIVSLTRNKKIKKEAEVQFYPPEKLKIVKYNFETSVGDYVILHIAIYSQINGSLVAYTACDTVNLDIEFSNEIFNEDLNTSRKSEVKDSCRKIYLKAMSTGSTNLKVSYPFSGKVFSDEVFLVTFDKLAILNPLENEIVLPIGASRNVFYQNGSRKIMNSEAELIKRITFDKEYISAFEVENKVSENIVIYNILCKKVGDQEIFIDIHNELNSLDVVPYIKSFKTKVFCVKPRFLTLHTIEKLKTECPLKTQDTQLYLQTANDHIEIEIEVKDAQKRKLQNISSIDIAWKFVQNDDRSIAENIKFNQREAVEILEGVAVPKQNTLTVIINEVFSVVKVKGIITQYDEKILKYYMIEPEEPNFGISKSQSGKLVKPLIENELHILSVEKTLLAFASMSIFLPIKKAERVKLTQGSGFYNINDNPSEIIDVKFDEETRELVILPLKVGQTSVTIEDQCLSFEPSTIIISVVVIGKIEVQSLNRIEKTKSIEALVKIYDSNGNLFKIDIDHMESYQVKLDTEDSNLLSIKLGHQQNLKDGEIRFILTGLELGETKIIASSKNKYSEYDEERIVSSSISIQVFPPLTILPKNITIYEGSSIQLYSKGGPYPDVDVIYIVKNNQIAFINSTVVYGLKVGHTQIIGKCIDKNDMSNDKVKYSEDYVNLYVIPFDGITIRTPILRIKSGATVPATIWGLPNISPLVLGSLPSLEINWSTNQPKIIEIKGVFSQFGAQQNKMKTISVRINALTSGKAQLQAIVSSNGRKFTAHVDITVFKILELETPKKVTYDPIIIPPMASVHLKTNLNDAIFLLDQQNNSFIQVTKEGVVTSMVNNGRSEVIAQSVDQTLLIPIEVKNVHYILIQPYEAQLKNVEQYIPIGLNIGMRVSLHDNIGNEFAHTFENIHALSHRLSNKDLGNVRIDHFNLKAKFTYTSSNVLSVYLKDQNEVKYPDDYIHLIVNESNTLYPKQREFSVGDIICFDSPLAGSLKWHSQDPDSISVIAETGVAHVHTAKNTEVIITHSGDSQFSYFEFGLFIKELDKIEFIKKNDIFNGERYFGKLVLKNHLQLEKNMNVFGKNLSECLNKIQTGSNVDLFTCHLSIEQHSFRHVLKSFHSFPMFDIKTGVYGCVIDTIELLGDLKTIIKTADLGLILEARLSNGIKDIATLKFVPAISISPEIISIEQLEKKIITITGMEKIIQKVEVLSSHPNDLEITLFSKTEYTRNYRARLIRPNDNMHIIIKSFMTHQHIEIPIVSTNYVQQCSSQPMNHISHLLINVVSNLGSFVTAIVLIGAVAWILQSWQQKNSKIINVSPFKMDQYDPEPLNKSMNSSSLLQKTSPYQTNETVKFANTSMSPVYGDTALFSPQKRTYRRLL
ncbi:nuclear pore membrane glycoprotein 210 isoform X2 [Culicoides brevitarsis]